MHCPTTSRITRRRFGLLGLLIAGAAGLMTSAPDVARAAGYPDRPIHLVVGFPPGGGGDFVARQVAQSLGQALKTTVIVDNRAGANATIAATEVSRAAPDGYTLLLGVTASQSIAPLLMPRLPYSPLRDFTPITEVGFTPVVLVVNPKSPAHTVQEFIRMVGASPTPITFGSAGAGNITHLAGEKFILATGATNMQHIPFKGSAPAITDLMGGHIDAYFDSLPSSLPFIRNGQLRALAVTSRGRAAAAPDIPTMQEGGVAGYEATTWFGVFAPPKLDPKILEQLSDALRTSLATPESRQGLADRGVEPVLSTPSQFQAELEADLARWREVTRKVNVTLE